MDYGTGSPAAHVGSRASVREKRLHRSTVSGLQPTAPPWRLAKCATLRTLIHALQRRLQKARECALAAGGVLSAPFQPRSSRRPSLCGWHARIRHESGYLAFRHWLWFSLMSFSGCLNIAKTEYLFKIATPRRVSVGGRSMQHGRLWEANGTRSMRLVRRAPDMPAGRSCIGTHPAKAKNTVRREET